MTTANKSFFGDANAGEYRVIRGQSAGESPEFSWRPTVVMPTKSPRIPRRPVLAVTPLDAPSFRTFGHAGTR